MASISTQRASRKIKNKTTTSREDRRYSGNEKAFKTVRKADLTGILLEYWFTSRCNLKLFMKRYRASPAFITSSGSEAVKKKTPGRDENWRLKIYFPRRGPTPIVFLPQRLKLIFFFAQPPAAVPSPPPTYTTSAVPCFFFLSIFVADLPAISCT